jgi:hypothetical protein
MDYSFQILLVSSPCMDQSCNESDPDPQVLDPYFFFLKTRTRPNVKYMDPQGPVRITCNYILCACIPYTRAHVLVSPFPGTEMKLLHSNKQLKPYLDSSHG